MLAPLLLVSLSVLAPVQPQDCQVSPLSIDNAGLRAELVAIDGQLTYVLQRATNGFHSIDVRGPLVANSQPPSIDSVVGTPLLSDPSVRFEGLTAGARGIQAVAAGAPGAGAILVEWRKDLSDNWAESRLALTGTTVAEGQNLVFDGRRWAALSVTEPGDVFVDLIVRDPSGKLAIDETLPIGVSNAIAPERPTGIALDGRLIVVRVTADSFMGTLVIEDVPGQGWTLQASLPEVFADAEPSTAAVAIKGDRIAVTRDLGSSFQQHVVLMYSRNPVAGTGWAPVALLELPGATSPGLDRRNIEDVEIQGDRVWISQAGSSGMTAYAQTGPGGDYGLVGTIRGAGGPIAVSQDWVAGLTSTGTTFAGIGAFKNCLSLYAR